MRETTMIIGDTHGDAMFVSGCHKVARQLDVTTIVQLGDFGYTFDSNMMGSIISWLDRDRSHVWYWVDGNHDNHDFLDHLKEDEDVSAPISMPAYHERLHYVPRGAVFEIGETTCMGLGGAYSIDRRSRRPHVSWWPQELITNGDVERAIHNAEGRKIDVMFTHDSPPSVFMEAWLDEYGYKVDDQSLHNRQMLGVAVDNIRPVFLYHGHYHTRYSTSHELKDGWTVNIEGVGANLRHTVQGQRIDHTPYRDGNYLIRRM